MKARNISYRRTFTITMFASLAIMYFILWLHMITTPTQYLGSDFIAFYAAGRISQNEGASHAYDLSLQQKYEGQVVGFKIMQKEAISPFLNPPFVIPLTQIVATKHYLISLTLWNCMMLAVFILNAIVLLKLTTGLELNRQQWATLLAGILIFSPAFESILIGQNSALLCLGVSIWFYGILKDNEQLSGLGLGLTTVRPHIALLLATPFIFRRRNVWWSFLVSTLVLALFSLMYTDTKGVIGFLHVLFISGSGTGYNTKETSMVNLIGLMLRLFPYAPAQIIRSMGWGIYALALIGLCVFWARSGRIGEKQISTAIILSVIAAPHLHYHDLAILIVPIFSLILILIREKHWEIQNVVLIPLGISTFLFLTSYSEFLLRTVPYFLELFILLGLFFPDKMKISRKQNISGA